jgi:ABC-2 type transport system permease protein
MLRKELQQLPRKRGAMLSAVLFPLLFMVLMPGFQIYGLLIAPDDLPTTQVANLPTGMTLPAGISAVSQHPSQALRLLTFPLIALIGGLVVPSVMATYTIVAERERRTLDLLVALPISLGALLGAKLLATLLVGAAVTVPLLMLDCAVAIAFGILGPADAAVLLLLLIVALAYSTTAALVVSLLSGDFRTANNVNGALIGPLIVVALAMLALLPPIVAPLAICVLLLVFAVVFLVASIRWLTVERLLR